MDYRIQVNPKEPCDICIYTKNNSLMAAVLDEYHIDIHLLTSNNVINTDVGFLFTNLQTETGIFQVRVVSPTTENNTFLATVNGVSGERINIKDAFYRELVLKE